MIDMDKARVIEVIETTLLRRWTGKDQDSPIRIITQYWSLEGELLAEVDPTGGSVDVMVLYRDDISGGP